jgi:uncharacterized delta-60 repeat protein
MREEYIQMKSTSTVLFVLLLASFGGAQQTWFKTCGEAANDEGYAVQQTSDGGYIIAGTTWSRGAGSADFYLIKTNASGDDTLWTRTYGGTRDEFGKSVQQTSDSGYIIAGYTTSFGAGMADFYLIKTNASGDTLWTRTYGGSEPDVGRSVQQTLDGGYIVTGLTSSFGAGYADVYLIKTNADGDTIWTRTYGGRQADEGYSVQQTLDGGYIVTGWTGSSGAGGVDVYLIKTNASGDTLWTRTYGRENHDAGNSVQQASDGGYIIAGYTRSLGTEEKDVYLVRTNASGDTLWTRTYGGAEDDEGYAARQTSDGGCILAGTVSSFGAGGHDACLIKTDSSGTRLWARTYGGAEDDEGSAVQQTSDGGYIVTGWTKSFGAGQADVLLIKTDADGNTGTK